MILEIGEQQDIIITDSPILLSAIYDRNQDLLFRQLVLQEFTEMNNLNFFIKRVKPYKQAGRYQDEAGAREIDEKIYNFLRDNGIPFEVVPWDADASEKIAEIVMLETLFPH